MTYLQTKLVRPMVAVLAFALCGAPEVIAQTAQTQPAPTAQSQDATQQQSPSQAWPGQDTTTTPTTPAALAPATNNPAPTPAPDIQAPAQQQPAAPQQRGTTIDPSAAPVSPTPDTQSNAPTQRPEEQTNLPANPQPQTVIQRPPASQQPSPEPTGTAAAESVRTAGSSASKPAGVAIAPAKQHRVRSLLIKMGAIAAAGAALGTVYALTRGTPSTPPGTAGTTPGAH